MIGLRCKWLAVLTAAAGLAVEGNVLALHAGPALFQEVYELIRTNLAGVTEADLERATVEGLVQQLQPRVQLVGERDQPNETAQQPALSEARLFDGQVACFKITKVCKGLADDLRSAFESMARTSNLNGLVLDLRFADGSDYAAAGAVADLFTSSERLLLDWGSGVARTSAKTNAIRLPVAVLVNRQTSEAAEALAAVLRQTGAGLILGTNTAGRALVMDEFRLQNGQRLRLARSGVRLADGELLTTGGVEPDIRVAVNPAEERAYWRDPYAKPGEANIVSAGGQSSTNGAVTAASRPARRRFNEAELVRAHREGFDLSTNEPAASGGGQTEPEPPVVRDAVLARALDLIKGLAVVRRMQER